MLKTHKKNQYISEEKANKFQRRLHLKNRANNHLKQQEKKQNKLKKTF